MRRINDEEKSTTDSVGATLDSDTSRGHARDDEFHKLAKDRSAIDELACFLDFMETRIMPDARRYRNPTDPEAQSIRHEDIWYLIKPGDLIHIPKRPSSNLRISSSPSAHSFFRVVLTSLTTTSPKRAPSPLSKDLFSSGWNLVCELIDYNGTSYASLPIVYTHLVSFSGTKRVVDLDFYPISYLKDGQELLAQAKADGAKLLSLIDRRFASYSGWTQTSDALGMPLRKFSADGRPYNSPEHIEGDVLIDYQETFNAFPTWRSPFIQDAMEADSVVRSKFTNDDLNILEWSDTGKTYCAHFAGDRYLSTDETERADSNAFLKQSIRSKTSMDAKSLTGQMLALIPRFFFGFAVLERKFVRLDIRCVRNMDQGDADKAFARLEISPSYKKLILALVKSHFDKIETEKRTHVEIESQDLIRGKGKGIIILLHGVPGVGKTATAEAVAQKWNKPLFPITCGHLGYTAESLEKSLTEIFRLAHHWGCILLLDEADVFITRRERHDLKRNALVSVLEYYDGIMFLTTNRPGVLDDAVKSRVHLNLHYDHLNEEQTAAIYKQHIQRLKEIEKQRNSDPSERIVILHNEILQFARDHYNQVHENRSVGRWNGRQIRNAFLIASSLTHYDDENESEVGDADDLADPNVKVQKQLGRKQFEIVADTTLLYDQYRESVHSGKSDDHVAFEREERATSSQAIPQTPSRLRTPSTR
ncbi:hypothetical protein N0V93_002482 [Gnomoniopsis smithogilvyi]|uniref:AAA+ ATPase domain-containing protein n=1 Tax=Gnomoniopsis smithogilvyi TaxID=1191159 RepID=A0A9W8YUV3_9PEZI|nr:hypothetical protein N0V93_002482 [Gnomoniopsis smithogilvyi]